MGRVSPGRIFARVFAVASGCAVLPLILCLGAASAQAQPSQTSVEARTAGLARILAEYHQDELKHEPELATPAGETRYDDQLPDLSASAENAWIARGQTYIIKLSEIDTAGVPDTVRLPAERLLSTLLGEQEETHVRQWQMPLTQFSTLDSRLLALAAHLPFTSAKNYADYIERLRKIPMAFSQIMTNLQLGVDQGRLPARSEVDRVQAQMRMVTAQAGQANPFAAPLTRFPATVNAADRKRITDDLLDTIDNAVVPAYQRVGRFVAALPVPTGHIETHGEALASVAP